MEQIVNTETTEKQPDVKHRLIYGDLMSIAKQIANDVCIAVALEVEDINTNAYEFRSAIESTTSRILQHLEKSSERIGIYEEALPGFTLMVIKKEDGQILPTEKPKEEKKQRRVSSLAFDTASLLIQNFMNKTKRSILSIEHDHILVLMFPVSDTRKHLKTLGIELS